MACSPALICRLAEESAAAARAPAPASVSVPGTTAPARASVVPSSVVVWAAPAVGATSSPAADSTSESGVGVGHGGGGILLGGGDRDGAKGNDGNDRLHDVGLGVCVKINLKFVF